MVRGKVWKGHPLKISIGMTRLAALLQTTQTENWTMFMHNTWFTGVADEIVKSPLKVLWKYATCNIVAFSSVVLGGVVYVGSGDRNAYAPDVAIGALKWNYATGDWVTSSPVGVIKI